MPAGRRGHTSEVVSFDDVSGQRVAIIGGRQSAYEWAALLCDHGAAKVDVIHRHETPRFEKVSWKFVDELVDQTLAERGWWRNLAATRQQEIALQFWQVGRLTLEWWLIPRLKPAVVTSRPGTEVVAVAPDPDDVTLTLSDGDRLAVDRVVFASGYRADLAAVPYLSGVLDRVSVTDGFPDLSPGFETSLRRALRHRLRLDPRLRPVLRLHQGLPRPPGSSSRCCGEVRYPVPDRAVNPDRDRGLISGY